MITNKVQAFCKVNELGNDLELGKMEELVPQFLRSGIEVFSHQIYAATFALSNPFVKGFILADEAGLGKTMEALLILSKYISNKKNALVIVPSPTLDNWLTDIIRTFNFHCVLLDTKERPAGCDFSQTLYKFEYGVVLTTYDYIMTNPNYFKTINWDLCILDEAHRFRTYKIKENKTADTILSIAPNAKKILLTATPIQKNEDDIYGLINFIDENVFTDYEEFHKKYFRKSQNYPELREAIAPYTFRTLRSQVKIETKLTDREILTQIYKMTDKEQELYKLINNYVSKPKRYAFPEMDIYELSLMMYGSLSSSAFAFSKMLSGIYFRLKKNGGEEYKKEASEIKTMLDIATSITENNKDKMLIQALDFTFKQLSKKKINQKCVIFTQNTQTQEHINKILKSNTDYEVYSFNGTTDNEPINKFKRADKPSILISTDKGNDSLNWQEAAFVINYDFPQVLLEMEQRISRCHRIKQDSDVFVLNFICPENFYDVRMYELFYKRVNVSNNILGASDNIISGAVDGDIQENILDTFNKVRKKKEVQIEFSEISEKFKEELQEITASSNDMLFNTFDKTLVERTKNMAEIIKRKVDELKETIIELARFYYKDAFISENVFECKTAWHRKNPFARPSQFSLIDDGEHNYFSFGSEPCQDMLTSIGFTYSLEKAKIKLIDDNSQCIIDNAQLRKGYILIYSLSFNIGVARTSKNNLFVGIDENGQEISPEVCKQIINLECESYINEEIDDKIIKKLYDLRDEKISIIETPIKEEFEKNADLPVNHIKAKGEKGKQAFTKEIEALEKQLNAIKSASHNDNFSDGLGKNQMINDLTEKLYALKDEEFITKAKINKSIKQEIDEFYEQNKLQLTKYDHFVIEFEIV